MGMEDDEDDSFSKGQQITHIIQLYHSIPLLSVSKNTNHPQNFEFKINTHGYGGMEDDEEDNLSKGQQIITHTHTSFNFIILSQFHCQFQNTTILKILNSKLTCYRTMRRII